MTSHISPPLVLVSLIAVLFTQLRGQSVPRDPSLGSLAGQRSGSDWIRESTIHLPLDMKIGQMLAIRIYCDYPDFNDIGYRTTRDLIGRYHIGSLELGARMNGPNLVKSSPQRVAQILNQLQHDSDLPLLIAADIERGLASRVSNVPQFPFPMALGAANDVSISEQFAAITADEARAIGIHWALAPVSDVNSNSENPVIVNRSFGQDPDRVGDFVAAFIRGAHKKGLLVTSKHFPGHGDSATDSHVGVITIDGDSAHLQRFELPPFRRAIEAGVDAVMLAHARVPALDPDPNKIATTSPKIIEGTLRKQLGFNGVVVTDALEMRGLTALYPNEPSPTAQAAVDAVKAGADIVTLPTDLDGAYHAILDAVLKGEISESRIDESVRRILALKAAVGLNKSRFVDLKRVDEVFSRKQDFEFAQHVSDEAVTLVRNSGDSLPLTSASHSNSSGNAHPTRQDKVVGIVFSDSAKSPLGHELETQFMARQPGARFLHWYYDLREIESPPQEILSAVESADRVVVAAFITNLPGRKYAAGSRVVGVYSLMGPSAQLFSQILSLGGKKVTVVTLGSPYLILHYPIIQNYICTYSTATTSEISAVKALFGEIQNHAKLPVTLPGVAKRGFSLPWPIRQKTAQQVSTVTH